LRGEAFSCLDTSQQRLTDEQTHFSESRDKNKQTKELFIYISNIDMAYL